TVPQPDGRYTFIDQGEQRFTYRLLPHVGSWEDAGTTRRASELNRPPVAIVESFHAGALPWHDSFACVEPESVQIAVIKRAEDGDDLILRCLETSGRDTAATIRLPRWNRAIETTFGPNEIKTFRVPADESTPIQETNLIEWRMEATR
ncbi:MAG TPA: glycosyl hydrolase-related protein, partial [Chloroflexota bacterium]